MAPMPTSLCHLFNIILIALVAQVPLDIIIEMSPQVIKAQKWRFVLGDA